MRGEGRGLRSCSGPELAASWLSHPDPQRGKADRGLVGGRPSPSLRSLPPPPPRPAVSPGRLTAFLCDDESGPGVSCSHGGVKVGGGPGSSPGWGRVPWAAATLTLSPPDTSWGQRGSQLPFNPGFGGFWGSLGLAGGGFRPWQGQSQPCQCPWEGTGRSRDGLPHPWGVTAWHGTSPWGGQAALPGGLPACSPCAGWQWRGVAYKLSPGSVPMVCPLCLGGLETRQRGAGEAPQPSEAGPCLSFPPCSQRG